MIRNKILYKSAGESENKILNELYKASPENTNFIIQQFESFEFRGHFCIVFELLGANLYEFMNYSNGLSLQLVKRIVIQLLMALKAIHSANIIHCDLKPDNILLKNKGKSSIKLIDFGSACYESNKVLEYIQSRYYRAPEILLETSYDRKIDIWSLGCIVVELLIGQPLFPAKSECELFNMFVVTLGLPPKDFMALGKRSKYYTKLNKSIKPATKTIELVLHGFDSGLVDFVKGCLKWKPEERMDAEVGLFHPWIKGNKISENCN